MATRKWLFAACTLAFLGCDGGAGAPKPPAGGTAPVAKPGSGPQLSGPDDRPRVRFLIGEDEYKPVAKPGSGPQLSGQQSEWVTFSPDDGGFSVQLPARPEVSTVPGGAFTSHHATCDHNGVSYIVMYFDPPPAAIAPNVVDATLKRDRDSGVQDIQGTLTSEEKISIQKDGHDWPGLASVMENSTHRYCGRQYAVDGRRVYALQAGYARNEDHAADIKKFFDSFKISSSKPK